VSHAIVLLGFNVVKGLALSTSVFEALARESEGLWQHSLGTAVLSRRMAKELNLADPEEIMIAGLLHDLGKVVLAHFAIDEYRAAIEEARTRRIHIGEVEVAHFEVDHARIGAWVAEAWHLPERLTVTMAHHHAPARAKSHKETVAIVHLADILARGMGYGDPGDNVLPPLDHEAFHAVGLSYHRIDQILVEAEKEYNSGADLFRGGA
jgi:putative nucleotidyltransferase with HDIG domain